MSGDAFHEFAEQERNFVCGMNERLVGGIVRGLANESVGVVLDPVPGECCVRLEPPGHGDPPRRSPKPK